MNRMFLLGLLLLSSCVASPPPPKGSSQELLNTIANDYTELVKRGYKVSVVETDTGVYVEAKNERVLYSNE